MRTRFFSWLFHIVFVLSSLVVVVFFFYFVLLPRYTLFKEFIRVPNVVGKDLNEAIEEITKTKLNYYLSSAVSYNRNYKRGSIVDQNPVAGIEVKPNRMVFITVNVETKVHMPNLVYQTLRNAYVILKSKGLNIGNVQYVSDIADNVVLEQFIEGKKILADVSIVLPQNVDLLVGVNNLKKNVKIPKFVGKSLDEAYICAFNNYICLKKVTYIIDKKHSAGIVVHQSIAAGSIRSVGVALNIVVSR